MQAEQLALRLQTLAYHRALVMAHERRSAIITLTDELVGNEDETVLGERLYSLLADSPCEAVDASVRESLPFTEILPTEVRQPLSQRLALPSLGMWSRRRHVGHGLTDDI